MDEENKNPVFRYCEENNLKYEIEQRAVEKKIWGYNKETKEMGFITVQCEQNVYKIEVSPNKYIEVIEKYGEYEKDGMHYAIMTQDGEIRFQKTSFEGKEGWKVTRGIFKEYPETDSNNVPIKDDKGNVVMDKVFCDRETFFVEDEAFYDRFLEKQLEQNQSSIITTQTYCEEYEKNYNKTEPELSFEPIDGNFYGMCNLKTGNISINTNRKELFQTDKDNNIIYDEAGKAQLSPMGECTYIHEKQHWLNSQAQLYDPTGVSKDDIFKLNMLDEVSSNMATVGHIYENYKKAETDEEKQQWLNCCETLVLDSKAKDKIKEIIQNGTDDAQIKKDLARETYNGWMEQNNKKYYEIGEVCLSTEYPIRAGYVNPFPYRDQADGVTKPYPSSSFKERIHPTTEKEFLYRADMLFRNIPGLGDVRDVLGKDKYDFKVNAFEKTHGMYATFEKDAKIVYTERSNIRDQMKKDKKTQRQAINDLEKISETTEKSGNKDVIKEDKIAKVQYHEQHCR